MDMHKHHNHGHDMETTSEKHKHEHHVTETIPYHIADDNSTMSNSMGDHGKNHDNHDMGGHDIHMNHNHDMGDHSAHMDHANHDMGDHSGHMDHANHDMGDHSAHMDHANHDMGDHTTHMNHANHDMGDHDMHMNHDNHMNHDSHDMGDHSLHMDHANTHMNHHDSSAHHAHQHTHPMTFHTRNDDYILFRDWQLSPGKVVFFVCLALVLMAVLYQAIKMFRARLGRRCPNTHCKRYILSKGHILQTVFYMVQFVVGYALMLAVMTYNAWIMAATVFGIGLGYFFFGWAEYEEIVKLQPIGMKINNRTRIKDCGRTGDQELLPLSHETTATDLSLLASNATCSCEGGEL